VGGEATIPCPWGLFKSVKGLVEAADIIQMRGINETSGLRTVDHLSESSVKKSIVDVELMHGPITGESNIEDCANSGRLDDGDESLIIVDTRTLGEAVKCALYRSRDPSE
jgi:predicted hydrolase (HD superfamily)